MEFVHEYYSIQISSFTVWMIKQSFDNLFMSINASFTKFLVIMIHFCYFWQNTEKSPNIRWILRKMRLVRKHKVSRWELTRETMYRSDSTLINADDTLPPISSEIYVDIGVERAECYCCWGYLAIKEGYQDVYAGWTWRVPSSLYGPLCA